MKEISFEAKNRTAILLDDKYEDELKEFFSFSVDGARFTYAYKSGYWDGRQRMLKNKRLSMGLLRGMKDELLKAGYKVRLRRWKDRPSVKIKHGMEMNDPQYAYQNDCVQAMVDAVQWGGGLVLSATGTGKTAISGMLLSWLDCEILFVVDQVNLLYQSQEELEKWLKEKVGVVGDSTYEPRRVTVATIQTLHKHRNKERFRKWFEKVKVVLIDEVHVQMSRRNFDVLNTIKPQAVFGLTATLQMKKKPVRMRAMAICGPILYEFPIKEATEQGVLSTGVAIEIDVDCRRVFRPAHVTVPPGVRNRYFNRDYEWQVVTNDITNDAIVELTKTAIRRDYAVIILVERRHHLFTLRDMLREQNPQICAGGVSTDSRKRRQKRFEQGDANLIIATKVFKKGINLKRVDLIIDAAQMQNKDDALQKYGRGVRLHKEKKGLIYFHIKSAISYKGRKKPATEKAASSRYNAFKKAGIPVARINYTDAKEVMHSAEKMLEQVLNEPKQFKLFPGGKRS